MKARDAISAALLLLAIGGGLVAGALRPIDDVLAVLRFDATSRPASQSLTVLEIDSRSLRSAGAWPWDRARYAEAIDNLVEAGATLVAFDVDFSAPSTPAGDKALAEAIARHPGQIALANFVQNDTYGARDSGVVENRPIPELRQNALLATVNVPVDSDGKVRGYDMRSLTSSQPSVAALMAGSSSGPGSYDIDFGIDHRTIPHLSFEDVLQDRFDRSLVSGRVILVGATALELGDEFATPAGLIPGVYIHGLAYESLVQGRRLFTLHPLATVALCGLLIFLLRPRRGGGAPLRGLIIRHGVSALLLLFAPIGLQAISPLGLQVGVLLCTQVAMAVWATRVELARRAHAIIQEREAGLLHLAMHQPETGLPNRRSLTQRIQAAWERCPEAGIAVVTIGVARHAEMRGVVGYAVADGLLSQLAARTRALVGVEVAQIATSTLAFMLQDLPEGELGGVLDGLKSLETTFQVDGHAIDIFLRMGAVEEGRGPVSPELLLERATLALNHAGEADGHAVVYSDDSFGSPANNLALMSEMRRAMASGDIALHYQPKLSLSDDGVRSVEALCRWRHPERGFISPDLFIPIAEETGQIRALTEWSLEQAIRDQARLQEWGHDVMIALNISGRLLTDEAFRTHVLERVARHPLRLCFEITETAVIQHPVLATDALAAFRSAGIKISIDDYGSGLSSLGYLKALKADELKIDKSLVVDVLDSQRDRLIMKSTVDLAHSLNMTVVAEGVETEALAASLRLLGCDAIQGYWFARALPILQLAEFLDGRAEAFPTLSMPVDLLKAG
ncbi:putative bifunctional diguanylate cyclase/phosphodiesterase [Brevundimonas sp. NPDC092305]|uniref:putative bifunctional diguanylate cyclase/phosphodiesterase n=1 Tax=Brevundimonas sp. NPDC092305 TaxID=3363957 RepID=UPI003827A8B5